MTLYRSAGDIKPELDGKEFINIYSKCQTRIGKQLSHFTKLAFVHPYFGPFTSMEGFWYYIRSGKRHDELRYLYGLTAKKVGRELKIEYNQHFKEDIIAGNYQKIIQNPELREMIIQSTLPFTHYYLFTNSNKEISATLKPIVIFPKNSDWLLDGFEEIRKCLKEDTIPVAWTNASQRYVEEMTDKN